MTARRIVYVGLGKMGAPMAGHLRAAGHAVTGVEPDAVRRAALGDLPVYATLADATAAARDGDAALIVVSSLPDDAALRAVARALAASTRPGDVWVDTSTVSVDASREAAAHGAGAGLHYLRAPVSGNAVMAQQARLTVLASGDAAAWAAAEPLFACWGPKRLYLGPADEARVAKLVVNLMVAATSGMLAEALAIGQGAGVSPDRLWPVILDSAVASPILAAKAPALQAGDWSPTFTVHQMRKDLALVRGLADAGGVPAPMSALVDDAMARAIEAGGGELDYAVIVRDALTAARN